MDFTEQVAIVIGGSGGIGQATVRMLTERGANVMVGYYQNAQAAEALVAESQKTRGNAVAQQVDIRSRESVESLVEATIGQWGKIDILINCAGISSFSSFSDISLEQWQNMISINLEGIFHACKAVLRPMMRRHYGRIVNVSALHGLAGGPMQADFSASTGGIFGLTRSLARESAAWEITVNAVAAGLITTNMLNVLPEQEREWGERIMALRRSGKPEEAAAAIVFLASPLASYITGQVLSVDGGWRMAQ
jgi:3-oxoacyl-[acyl-carrier protein] reductase